jgi:hypothetical protein
VPRRSRAYRRFHTDRVIAKRVRQARLFAWWQDPGWEPERGRLANDQSYLGCHTPGCCLCRPHKCRGNADRQRAEREWRRFEDVD